MSKVRPLHAVSPVQEEKPPSEDAASAPVMVLKRDAETDEGIWRNKVLDRCRNACSNCGSTDRVQVHFVVPLSAGGTLVESNGYVLCRSCEMAREIAKKQPAGARRPINFWVSNYLYTLLEKLTAPGRRFTSMGALIRYLISIYVTSPEQFDDLGNYQDRGTDSKVNAWVAQDSYESFKALVDGRNLTVTDALKGLILLYSEKDPVSEESVSVSTEVKETHE